jgi:malonyl-CoA/methylmalonyl-CoA synthetase
VVGARYEEIPQEMKVVETIPRNAMGKINKKQLVIQIWGEPLEGGKDKGAVQVPSGSV